MSEEIDYPPAFPWLVYLDEDNLEELMIDLAAVVEEPDLGKARIALNRLAYEWDESVTKMRAKGELS